MWPEQGNPEVGPAVPQWSGPSAEQTPGPLGSQSHCGVIPGPCWMLSWADKCRQGREGLSWLKGLGREKGPPLPGPIPAPII